MPGAAALVRSAGFGSVHVTNQIDAAANDNDRGDGPQDEYGHDVPPPQFLLLTPEITWQDD
jgi:hypothetical protein